MKYILFYCFLFFSINIKAQSCKCEKEFLHTTSLIENNFAGFPDRIKALSQKAYQKKVTDLLMLTRNNFSNDNCLLIISQYLNVFKSHHIGFSPTFDFSKLDTIFINQRPLFKINEDKLNKLKQSKSWEGIYYFTHDSSYKIAVIKDPTPLHDYVGVIVESKLPTWKKGMLKFEGKLINDSLSTGLLYMRNHRPKLEGFGLLDSNNMISGDWRREGTFKKERKKTSTANQNSPDIDFKILSPQTLYLKISSFETAYKSIIDSTLKINEEFLNTTTNLILDLRDNSGGSDNLWQPIIPYLYTNPIKTIGVDILVTDTTILGWKKYLEDKNLSKESKDEITSTIIKMENAKSKWMSIGADQIDSSFKAKLFPKKVIILINKWCGSSTEEFLLMARQSSKVTLVGENTIGNLDYSNVVQTPFSCFPYMLRYATTRSRRLNINQGIDNIGIAPKFYLNKEKDWIKEALKMLEN
jgi:hypothetical protein